MYVHGVFLFLLLSTVNCNDECPDKSQAPLVRLKNNLLCGYDRTTRPVLNHKNPVNVTLRMILKDFNYEMHSNAFTVDSWMALLWKDEHLKWNPDDFESIKTVHLLDSEIWMPDISIYNRNDQGGDQSAIGSVTCIVSSIGQVVCVPSTQYVSSCISDISKFPFDTHNCTIRFGSWVHSGEELNIQISKPPISTEDLLPNGDWELVNTAVIKHPGKFKCCPNSTYPSINFSFKIRRLHGAHTASIILPAIALIITTLTPLWIAPNHQERLALCYVNFIAQIFYIQDVSWTVPLNGDKTPLILLFARDSLLLATFTIVFSVILKNMVENEKPAPGWMSNLVCVLIASRPGRIAFLKGTPFQDLDVENADDSTAIVNNQEGSSKSKDWLIFAKILDRLCFVIYLIIYIIMFIGFMP